MKQEIQLSAIFLGTSLQFSNQFLRILDFEFPEVRFDRQPNAASLPDLDPPPGLVVIHEARPDLEETVLDARARVPEATIAVACTSVPGLRSVLGEETGRSVSILPLNTPIDVWLSILRLLLCGHTHLPADGVNGWHDAPSRQATDQSSSSTDDMTCLTPREMQILPLIAQGQQNKSIAGTLGLSEHTVKLHTHNIFAKLGVSNRTAAATWYLARVEQDGRSEPIHGE